MSTSGINLSWSDNSSNEEGFKIERSLDGVSFSEIASLPSNSTSFSNTGLSASTQYYYRVRGYNASATSSYSNTASATTLSPSDTTPPLVTISSPLNGTTVSGVVMVSASASDNVGVTKVEFYIDNSLIASDTSSPYSISLDSTKYANGPHSLTAKAYDAAGNIGVSSLVSINISNSISDTTPPTVSVTSPVNGSLVDRRSTITISAMASDNVAVTRVEIYVNGVLVCTDTMAPYSCTWKVPGGKSGKTYGIQAKAYDAPGNFALSSSVTVSAK